MKQTLLIAIIITTFNIVKSQEIHFQKPDYVLIKKETQEISSIYYYPDLMSRLEAFDTTLTSDDYRHLYYGYVFHENYKPYWTSPYEKELVYYYRRKKVRKNDYDKIIELANNSINEFPFDLRQLNYLGYIYHLKGEEELARKITSRFHGIINAIMSTGNGESCETGFHVISVSHEYVMLNMFQFQKKQQSLIGDCDYLELIKDERNIEGIYFNIGSLFKKNLEVLKKE